MDFKDLFRVREMPEEKPQPNAEQYAPLFEERKEVTLFKIVCKLADLGAEFDIKACGVHITNKSNE